MPVPSPGPEESAVCSPRCWAFAGLAGGAVGLFLLAMFCSVLVRRCFRKEIAPALPPDDGALDGHGGDQWSATQDVGRACRAATPPHSAVKECLGASPEPASGGSPEVSVVSTPAWAHQPSHVGRMSPMRSQQGLQHQSSPGSSGGQSAAYQSPPTVRAGDRAAGGAAVGPAHAVAGPATPSFGIGSPERRACASRPPSSPGKTSQASRPIEEIIVDAAKSHDLHWSVRVGTCEKSLVELLVDAFAMLGISTSEELLEQFQSDSGRRENAWIGTKDLLMANVRTYVQEVGLGPDEARPLLGAASGLLSRSLRRFAVQAAAGGNSFDSAKGLLSSLPSTEHPSGLLLGPCSPESAPEKPAIASPRDFAHEAGEDRILERAFHIVDWTTAELARITAAASKAPRHEAQALFARRRALEESEKYTAALSYIEERMAPAGDGGACFWELPLCSVAPPLCDLEPEGSLEECESMTSPGRSVEVRSRRIMQDDQVLLRL